jgi:hypothetical protein
MLVTYLFSGPLFPNNTKGRQGKIPNFNDFHYNCSATAAGVCLFDLIKVCPPAVVSLHPILRQINKSPKA